MEIQTEIPSPFSLFQLHFLIMFLTLKYECFNHPESLPTKNIGHIPNLHF